MENKVYTITEFSQLFKGDTKKALELFTHYVVDKKEIDYSTKNQALEIDVLTCQSFSVKLTFENVIIEDGRKPSHVIFKNVSFEVGNDGSYRMHFRNGLSESDSKSVFSFTEVNAEIKFTKYGYTDGTYAPGTNKLPWRIVIHKLHPLIMKAKVFGEAQLNFEEKRNMPFFKFMYIYLELYLRDDTHAAYGRKSISYNKDAISRYKLTKAMLKILQDTFPGIEGTEALMGAAEDYENDRDNFFTEWCYYLNSHKGNKLYEYICNAINSCADFYEYGDLGYKAAHYRAEESIQMMAAELKLKGLMPNFIWKMKSRRQDFAFVYQRRYMKADANYKYIYITLLFDEEDNEIIITPLVGSVISRGKFTDTLIAETGISCCFSNDGRERHFLLASEKFPKDSLENVYAKWFDAVMEKTRGIYA